jgi:acyl carrier protein
MNMWTEETVCQRLLSFVQANSQLGETIEAATDLLESGVIDSLMVADLFVLIETQWGLALKATDVSPQNFRSVDCLTRLVLEKQRKIVKAA